jgi:hypothetical protein
MTLQEFIKTIEEEKLELWLNAILPKDGISLYLNAKEFQEPKRQRTSIDPNTHNLPDDIYND